MSRENRHGRILRCLGASSGQCLAMYVAQAAAMGLLGAIAGAALGVAVPIRLPTVFKDFLPVDVKVQLEPQAILTGVLIGGWIALFFALRPLLALRNVSPLQTLRRDADSEVLKMRWNDVPRVAVNVALVLSILLIGLLGHRNLKQGFWISASTGGAIAILAALQCSCLTPREERFEPGGATRSAGCGKSLPTRESTRSVILSLGFGAFLITTCISCRAIC
jgi:putative ABC transport system permease protein